MSMPSPKPMSLPEFLAWEAGQEEKHELIDGFPLPRRLRAMSGGTRRHALIGANTASVLRSRLRGGPCRAYGSDLKVASPTGRVRYPDALVECGRGDPTALLAIDPKVVIEVLSPSNTFVHQERVLEDYQAIASVDYVIFIHQDQPLAWLWRREGAAWTREVVEGLDCELNLAGLDLALPMAELYEGAEV